MQTITNTKAIDTVKITSYQVVPESEKITIWYSVGYMQTVGSPPVEEFYSVESNQHHIIVDGYAPLINMTHTAMVDELYVIVQALL